MNQKFIKLLKENDIFVLIDGYTTGRIVENAVELAVIPKPEIDSFIEMASKIIGRPFPLSKTPSVTQIDYIINFIKENKQNIDQTKFRTNYPNIIKNINTLISFRKK